MAAVLLVVVCAVFALTLRNDFIDFDDPDYVTENIHVSRGITLDGISWALTSREASNWHPVTWLSHMLDVELYALNPAGHHATSVLIHAVTTAMVFMLFWQLTGALGCSAALALLWGLHPLRVESVAWVSERKDVLCAFFWVLSTWFYLRWRRSERSWDYVLLFISYAIGLMSKPMLVTFPFTLMLLDRWPLRRDGFHFTEKLPLFVLTVVACGITYWAQSGGGAVATVEQAAFADRVANATLSYAMYVGKIFWPSGLSAYYLFYASIPSWKVIAAATFLMLALAQAWRWRQERPFVLIGLLWFVGTLVPVIGIVKVGSQAMADRFTYVPSLGLLWIVVWGAAELFQRLNAPRWLPHVLTLGVAGVLTLCTLDRVLDWRNTISLFGEAAALDSRNFMARNILGSAYFDQGQFEEAEAQLQAAVAIQPNDADIQSNLGATLVALNRYDEGIAHYRRAIALDTHDVKPVLNLAIALDQQGSDVPAIANYRKALALDPTLSQAHYNLALVLAQQGDFGAAELHFRSVVELRPGYAAAHNNLGNVLVALGKQDAAKRHYQLALDADPGNQSARSNLERLSP